MSRHSIRPWAGALAALGLLHVSQHTLPLAAAAQQPLPEARTEALLQGVVTHESTGQPVESATLWLVGTNIETQTGKDGGFAFPDTPIGMVSVRVTAPGHPSLVQEVEVSRDGIVFVRFILPSGTAVLDELLVEVRGDRWIGNPLTAADMLASKIPSARVTSGNIGLTGYAIRLRGSTASFTQSLGPLVYIDGVKVSRLGGAFDVLSQISASDVEDIEILRGPAASFLFPNAANGVVLVKTHSGSRR